MEETRKFPTPHVGWMTAAGETPLVRKNRVTSQAKSTGV